jgi:hypothetical protein
MLFMQILDAVMCSLPFVGAVSCHLQVTRMLPSLCRSNSVKKGSVIHDESRSSNSRIVL